MLSTPDVITENFFVGCSNLREIIFCENLITIQNNSISTYGALRSVFLPYSLETITYESLSPSDRKACFYGNVKVLTQVKSGQNKIAIHRCQTGWFYILKRRYHTIVSLYFIIINPKYIYDE